MATWHQMKNPVQLWHETLWSVVTDPPHGCLTVERFESADMAQTRANKHKHSYVLPPMQSHMRKS